MARPSRQLDKALIKAGKQLMLKGGASEISIRKVCAKAKVNTGMFNYFFGSRDRFVAIVHDEIYNDFYSDLVAAVPEDNDPVERLKEALLQFARIVRERRVIGVALIRDILNQEKTIMSFINEALPKDLFFILGLIRDCQKAGRFVGGIEEWQILSILMPVTIIPIWAGERVIKIAGKHIPSFKNPKYDTDNAISERIELVMKGLLR